MAQEAYDWRFYVAAGVAFFLASEVLELAGAPQGSPAYALLLAAFLAALGILCLRNWNACQARHCLVTGPAYLVLALAALLVAAGMAPFGTGPIWVGFGITVAVGVAASWFEPEPAPS